MRRGIVYLLIAASATGCGSALPKSYIQQFDGLDAFPADAALLAQAQGELAAGHAEAAISLASALRERHPNFIYVHQTYQDAMIAGGRKQEVKAEYQSLAETRKTALYYTLLSRLADSVDEGMGCARQARDRDDRFPWAWYALGWWEARGENVKNAEVWFRRALDLYPDFFPAMRAYAIMLRDSDASLAVGAIEAYVHKYPDRRRERVFLASLRLNTGQFEIAEEEFRRLVDENPADAEAWQGLAAAMIKNKKVDDARRIYERLLVEHPEDPSSYFNLAVISEEHKKDRAAAIHNYQKYLEAPGSQPFWYLARARLSLQELEEAQSRSSKTTESRPESKS